MKEFLRSMLSDGHNDSWSSKRVITFMAFLLCSVAFVGELFFSKSVTPSLFDSMMYIVIAGLGFTASEKFSNTK
jgi:hypothetical protein